MDVRETLRQAVEMGASDIFIIAGLPLTYKVDEIGRASCRERV